MSVEDQGSQTASEGYGSYVAAPAGPAALAALAGPAGLAAPAGLAGPAGPAGLAAPGPAEADAATPLTSPFLTSGSAPAPAAPMSTSTSTSTSTFGTYGGGPTLNGPFPPMPVGLAHGRSAASPWGGSVAVTGLAGVVLVFLGSWAVALFHPWAYGEMPHQLLALLPLMSFFMYVPYSVAGFLAARWPAIALVGGAFWMLVGVAWPVLGFLGVEDVPAAVGLPMSVLGAMTGASLPAALLVVTGVVAFILRQRISRLLASR